MAGRTYQISNSPARTPSDEIIEDEKIEKQSRKSKHEVYHTMTLDDIDKFDEEFEDDDSFDDEGSGGNKFPIMLALIGGVVGVLLVLYYFVVAPFLDITHGASSSDGVVNAVAAAMDDFSYANIETYVPKALREYGFISDSDEFAQFRQLDLEKGYKLKKVVIQDIKPFTNFSDLEAGLVDVYNRRVSISEANAVSLLLDFEDKNGQPVQIGCNIIPIKVNYRWYLYTGSMIDVDGEPFEFIVLPEETAELVEISAELSETEIEYKRPVIAAEEDESEKESESEDASELDFYEDAAADLAKGQCVIDGVVHTMPDAFASFGDMFTLNEKKLSVLSSTVLNQDETISNLPIKFSDEEYKDVPFAMTIGNTSTDAIDFRDARVTTLYIGQDAQGNAPEIVLPGGITFGASKTNVFKMYGNLQEVKNDETYKGTLADSVYALELSNKRNKIYLGFKNYKLVEIQWYYIDMTNYRDL